MVNAILSRINISGERTLCLRRYAGKRKTRVLIESKPTHQIEGIDFVNILFCQDFKDLKSATEKFNQLATT